MTKTWTFLKKNLDIILTIVGAAVVAVLGMSNVAKPEIVSAAILMILSLIAISLLVNRTTDSHLQQMAEVILEHTQKPSVDQVLLPYAKWMDEIDQRLWSAKEVWVLSRTCINIWQDYNDQFEKLLKAGGNVRLMLVDPNDGAVKMIVESAQGFEHFDVKLRRANIEAHIIRLARRRSQPKGKGLQVRTIDYLPAWTLILIDPQSEKGAIYVELATFRAQPRSRPTLSLAADRAPRLFQMFRDEFKTMWNRARPIAPAAYEEGTTCRKDLDRNMTGDRYETAPVVT